MSHLAETASYRESLHSLVPLIYGLITLVFIDAFGSWYAQDLVHRQASRQLNHPFNRHNSRYWSKRNHGSIACFPTYLSAIRRANYDGVFIVICRFRVLRILKIFKHSVG